MSNGHAEYRINKGINRQLEFKGLKGQYLAYLAGGLVILLLLASTAYLLGLSPWTILVIVLLLGSGLFAIVFHLNAKYGRHGMMKAIAHRQLPKGVVCRSIKTFVKLNGLNNAV
ncbi:DUF4133 domain-containing protein [Echinicola rosea]|uniref:DUF4133 domain-containing protein n=1 Tax=Echinicola rosea TaxID=1807691 RepID=A0ABQ1VA15_9BACT|nr:DUF4133 domain-containing protein [Echinicola rosea]GGF44168.1 hypothetical protein GCM10011339_35820 [Echinicola rosea]